MQNKWVPLEFVGFGSGRVIPYISPHLPQTQLKHYHEGKTDKQGRVIYIVDRGLSIESKPGFLVSRCERNFAVAGDDREAVPMHSVYESARPEVFGVVLNFDCANAGFLLPAYISLECLPVFSSWD